MTVSSIYLFIYIKKCTHMGKSTLCLYKAYKYYSGKLTQQVPTARVVVLRGLTLFNPSLAAYVYWHKGQIWNLILIRVIFSVGLDYTKTWSHWFSSSNKDGLLGHSWYQSLLIPVLSSVYYFFFNLLTEKANSRPWDLPILLTLWQVVVPSGPQRVQGLNEAGWLIKTWK